MPDIVPPPTIPFNNTYARLPERFYTRMPPTPVTEPRLIKMNKGLAAELGLDAGELAGPGGIAALAGNAVPEGAEPLAQVYAGHQFGGWSPRLGDGRAILLGEVVDLAGRHRDIQLKGAGPTPYSRMGDGRAWLGPVLREYIVSEAMHAMGVPTTRALAALSTGDTVLREAPFPGALLVRVASSHIRVGTFQYFASQRDIEALQTLTDYAIARHWPEADGALGLLNAVVDAQANLVAQWMGLGFIHGVMNTDNTTISGETIDYGPCAFMDRFEPAKVFSSIDQFGRYAFNRQPDIMVWNLAQLATALLPLIDADQDAGIKAAEAAVGRFPDAFNHAFEARFRLKLGLTTPEPEDMELIHAFLDLMAKGHADFTNAFRALGTPQARAQFLDPAAFDAWDAAWQARLARDPQDPLVTLRAANPAITPRNHRVEEAIAEALKGDYAPFERLVLALAHPFDDRSEFDDLTRAPSEAEAVAQTFCGT